MTRSSSWIEQWAKMFEAHALQWDGDHSRRRPISDLSIASDTYLAVVVGCDPETPVLVPKKLSNIEAVARALQAVETFMANQPFFHNQIILDHDEPTTITKIDPIEETRRAIAGEPPPTRSSFENIARSLGPAYHFLALPENQDLLDVAQRLAISTPLTLEDAVLKVLRFPEGEPSKL